MKNKKETKNRLKELRLAAGLKQSDLAKIVGCSQQTISNYETGFSTNLDSIVEEAIANYFSCTIEFYSIFIYSFYLGISPRNTTKQSISKVCIYCNSL